MKRPTTNHPSQSQLTAFLEGRLSEDDRISVEQHVEQCDVCCQAMSALPQDTLSARLRDVDTDAGEVSAKTGPVVVAGDGESQIPEALVDHPRYRILGPLGKGGMGMVYKAEHRMMDREVALKVIDARFINNPQAIERFRNEVKAAARLTHANIVRAYDAEQAGDLHFLVMEYVDGISLAELIRRNGPLPVNQVCGIVRKVAQGLHHAYEQGMVHRDIKPQNIMVTQDGRVRILDFGLARLAREQEKPAPASGHDPTDQMRRTADALTMVGSVLGTPDYIAPEQVMDAHRADTRADIYSLGCTAYFLLTGHPPYPHGSAMEKLVAHSEQTPSPIAEKRSDVPAEVIDITSQMMARSPQDRHQTPRDVAQAVDDFLKTGPSLPSETASFRQPMSRTVAEQHSPFSDPDLLKVDLSAISVEGSELLSAAGESAESVEESIAESATRPSETTPISSPPPRRKTSRRPSTERRNPKRPPQRTPVTRWTGFAPVVAVLTTVSVVFGGWLIFGGGGNSSPPVVNNAVPESSEVDPISSSPSASPRTIASSPPTVEVIGEWIDLLNDVDPTSPTDDEGHWQLSNGELTVDKVMWARILLPCDVPTEYDFEATFTRHTGVNSIALIFLANGRQATFDVDAWFKHLAGIQYIDGKDCQENSTRVAGYELVNGEQYTVRVRVLRDRVEPFVNDEPLTPYVGDGSNLSLIRDWSLSDSNAIGVGAYDSATTFHQVRIRPLGSSGR